jgi:hypothetical protein
MCGQNVEYVNIKTGGTHGDHCAVLIRPFATTLSQFKICHFSGEAFKDFEVL